MWNPGYVTTVEASTAHYADTFTVIDIVKRGLYFIGMALVRNIY
jgi:hypothetical protein